MRTDRSPLVVHLRATNFVGGPEKQIMEHMRRMGPSPFRQALCTFDEDGRPSSLHEAAVAQGLECHRLTARSPVDPRAALELAGLLRRLGAALLVTHGYKPNIIGRLGSWLARVPTWAVSRGWTGENRRVAFYERIDRLFLKFSNLVVAVSDGQKQLILCSGVAPGKVTTICNAIDVDSFPAPAPTSLRQEFGLPEDSVVVVSAGRLSPDKLHLGLVRVARSVCKLRPQVRFIVMGDGVLRQDMERLAREYGIQDRFIMTGFRKDAHSLFHHMDMLLLPSFSEGLPNIVLESFAASKPVVATAVSGTPEIVIDGVTGYLIKAFDEAMARDCIIKLTDSPSLRKSMGESGRKLVLSDYTFGIQTDKYMKLYNNLTVQTENNYNM